MKLKHLADHWKQFLWEDCDWKEFGGMPDDDIVTPTLALIGQVGNDDPKTDWTRAYQSLIEITDGSKPDEPDWIFDLALHIWSRMTLEQQLEQGNVQGCCWVTGAKARRGPKT